MITGSHFFEAIVELTIWIADAHRDDGKRFVVRADEKRRRFGNSNRRSKPSYLD